MDLEIQIKSKKVDLIDLDFFKSKCKSLMPWLRERYAHVCGLVYSDDGHRKRLVVGGDWVQFEHVEIYDFQAKTWTQGTVTRYFFKKYNLVL